MFPSVATNLAGFIIVLGFLIFVHEAGHFLVAKLFGVRVLVFSFGFGKRLFGFQKGDTDYRVSLIPLGGYVRMAGDVPRTIVSDGRRVPGQAQMAALPHPLRRPVHERPGRDCLPDLAQHGRHRGVSGRSPDSRRRCGRPPADKAGLKAGDRILEANGEKIETWTI